MSYCPIYHSIFDRLEKHKQPQIHHLSVYTLNGTKAKTFGVKIIYLLFFHKFHIKLAICKLIYCVSGCNLVSVVCFVISHTSEHCSNHWIWEPGDAWMIHRSELGGLTIKRKQSSDNVHLLDQYRGKNSKKKHWKTLRMCENYWLSTLWKIIGKSGCLEMKTKEEGWLITFVKQIHLDFMVTFTQKKEFRTKKSYKL